MLSAVGHFFEKIAPTSWTSDDTSNNMASTSESRAEPAHSPSKQSEGSKSPTKSDLGQRSASKASEKGSESAGEHFYSTLFFFLVKIWILRSLTCFLFGILLTKFSGAGGAKKGRGRPPGKGAASRFFFFLPFYSVLYIGAYCSLYFFQFCLFVIFCRGEGSWRYVGDLLFYTAVFLHWSVDWLPVVWSNIFIILFWLIDWLICLKFCGILFSQKILDSCNRSFFFHTVGIKEGGIKKGRGRPPGGAKKSPAKAAAKPAGSGSSRGRGRPPGSAAKKETASPKASSESKKKFWDVEEGIGPSLFL